MDELPLDPLLECPDVPVRPPDEPTSGRHEGSVGVRQDFPGAQCVLVKSIGMGEYGERFLVKFQTPNGGELVWFTGEGGRFDPKPGKTYALKATIREHAVYQGHRNTVIARATGVEL